MYPPPVEPFTPGPYPLQCTPMYGLPIDDAINDIRARLASGGALVLEAPPGAGKTTVVPLALLDEPWAANGKIVMLEPRRLAARAAARRMAALLGEQVGETVGYTMRLDRKVGPKTRIEVVTEGVLVRRLQRDPSLTDTALVIFDEFHERSLDADLALALTLEARAALRDDLKILVMSATLDGLAVAALLGGAPVVKSAGRAFPVATRYLDKSGDDYVADTVRLIRRALSEESGSILAFLPGVGEIRRAEQHLQSLPPDVVLAPLYGDMDAAAQDLAIRPAPPGVRKVVIATAIAETSLTIDGVTVVVDCGRSRLPHFDPATGMSRLETVRVSAAAAAQRRGRAGRTAPGVCYRAWTEAEDRALIPHHPPEIMAADLAPLALDLAQWGVEDAAQLAWLNPPPAAALAQARELLRELDALDRQNRITPHGKAMAELPLHPRLAHMVLKGNALGWGREAAILAALLSERDPVRGDRDLRTRLEEVAAGRLKPIVEAARRLAPTDVKLNQLRDLNTQAAGPLTALAYPDRIAKQRTGQSSNHMTTYMTTGGGGAILDAADPLAASDYLAIAATSGDRAQARIYLAAPLSLGDIEDLFGHDIEKRQVVAWDSRSKTVLAQQQERLWALPLVTRPAAASRDDIATAVLDGIRELGLDCLPWTPALRQWQARVMFLRAHEPDDWPDVSDAALLANLEHWLRPFVAGISRASQFDRIDLMAALSGLLDWSQSQRLDSMAPSHITVPSGSRLPVDYTDEGGPALHVRLQEMFGATNTPAIVNGRVPLTLHLLSPAHRPVQVTRDLAGFWARSYMEVKRDLKGRYPKHHWPDDPLSAPPTARAKRRGSS